jgi:hypothetical protein
MFAIAAIEHYCEAFPENAPALEWLFKPRRRHTLLSELGRLANPSSGKDGQLRWNGADVSKLIRAAHEIAELRPSTKEGVAMLRARRRRLRGDSRKSRTRADQVAADAM